MKTAHSLSIALAAIMVSAAPAAEPQLGAALGYEYNDLKKGDCKDVTFVWVRGTTEMSNMGEYVGGRLVPHLKRSFSSLAIQGVAYGAGVPGNLMPGGGDPAGIREAVKMYELAASKCPNTIITGGGYSQGAAITHRSVEKLSQSVKDRIAGITLYGDTQFKQDGGKIKGFPPEKVHTYCNGYAEWKSYSADGVCNGLLLVNYGHMTYGDALAPGAKFLAERVEAYKAANKKGKKPRPPVEEEEEEEEAAPKAEPKAKAKASSSKSSSGKSSSSSAKSSTSKSSASRSSEETSEEPKSSAAKNKESKSSASKSTGKAAAKSSDVVKAVAEESAAAEDEIVEEVPASKPATANSENTKTAKTRGFRGSASQSSSRKPSRLFGLSLPWADLELENS